MLIHSASQLLTLQGGPQRGHALGYARPARRWRRAGPGWRRSRPSVPPRTCWQPIPNEARLDACGCAVLPGFVDPHTHVIWAGERAAEFEMKMAGAKYLEILAAGGGILSTVRQTRLASLETLMDETRPRLRAHVRPRHHHRRSQDRLRPADRNRDPACWKPC